MGRFRREEDEADKWLREHDPYYTDTSRNKKAKCKYVYETPEMERRRREMEIPMSSLSLRQRESTERLSTYTDDII